MAVIGSDADSLKQSRAVSVALVVGLVTAVVACFLCALLTLLYAQRQGNGRKSSRTPKSLLPVLEKNYYHTPTLSTSSFGCTKANSAATSTTPVHSQWHTQPSTADHRAGYSTPIAYQSAEVLAAAHAPRLHSHNPLGTTLALPTDSRNSFSLKSASARRLGLDLERVWPPLLPQVQTERNSWQGQLLWRNSSGGSSCYSRPSSWYSISSTEELGEADLSCGLGAGPGPTLYAQHTTAYRYKALPPVPAQQEQSNTENIAAVNRI